MTFHCVHTWLNIFIYLLLQNNHNCDDQKSVVIMVKQFECVVAIMYFFHPGIVIVTALSDL